MTELKGGAGEGEGEHGVSLAWGGGMVCLQLLHRAVQNFAQLICSIQEKHFPQALCLVGRMVG